jgi:2-polyprenyl-6-methoxyphenol hydroxylase-like FAD-dependent oxidoreductase
MTDVDVLVVGCGPSGLTVAAEVARTGASVLVLERREVEPIPRAGTVLPRPLELFDARGIAEQFIRRTTEVNPNPYQSFHIWAGMAPVSWSARDSRFGFTLMLAQHETEEVLRRWAVDCGVEVRFRHEMVEVQDNGDDVTVVVRDGHGVTSSLQARYVVGADGGRGRTREQVGIDVVGHGDTFTGVIATAKMEFPWLGTTRTERNEHGWVAANRFGLGLTRFTMVHADGRATARTEPVTIPELNQSLSQILGEPIDIPEVVGASRYGDAMWMATKFRQGRVFLVGEAARVHYPASGVGMNFCIQDAFNLGWKLGAVIRGEAGEALLHTYEAERRPIAEDLFRSVNAQVAIQFDFSPRGLAFTEHFAKHLLTKPEVTEHLWAELNGLQTPYPQPDERPPPVGFPAPDFEMFLPDGSTTRLYELLRRHAFVVVDLSGTKALRALELPNDQIAVVDAQPIRRPVALRDVSALIVRPDTYVAWATTSTPSPDAVSAELARILSIERHL